MTFSYSINMRVAAREDYRDAVSIGFDENTAALTQEQRDALFEALKPRLQELRDLVRMTTAAAEPRVPGLTLDDAMVDITRQIDR